jgi:hypothetical protein
MAGTAHLRAGTTGSTQVVQAKGRHRAEQLAVLSLAMIAGVIGFLLVAFWAIALILLGILWGMMAFERHRLAEPEKGVLAEVVEVVVDAAKDVAHAGSSRERRFDPPPTPADEHPDQRRSVYKRTFSDPIHDDRRI